jgi:hypothetical protein
LHSDRVAQSAEKEGQMAWFMVSYDLRKEMSSDDYTKLYERLKLFSDWAWVLESVWIVQSTSSSAVYNHIAPALIKTMA